MKAAHRQVFGSAGLFAALAVAGAFQELGAQGAVRRTPPPDVARIMVPALRGSESRIGVQAADAIRSRLAQDISYRTLWVINKNDIAATLEASGFDPSQPLSPNDAKELAKLLRADEYLEGTVSKVPAGYRLESRLVLARDNALVQPLPPVEGARMDLLATQLSREVQAARKQLDDEAKCVAALRASNPDAAIAAAQAGIAEYEKSTLARLCLANAHIVKKSGPDQVIRIAEEVLAIHPRNKLALGWAADAYKEKGDQGKAIELYTDLLATDPTNTRLVEGIVNEIASAGDPGRAIPIINRAVAENPADPQLMQLQWRVLSAARDYKGAIRVGEAMIQADTALANAQYFQRMAGLYVADSQPQKSAEILARGLQKFPNDMDLRLGYAQQLRAAGQNQQAIAALAALPAATPRRNMLLAQTYIEMQQPDSALAALRAARAVDSASMVGPYALSEGNKIYRAANVSKNRADMERAHAFIALADSLAPSENSKLLMGITAFTVGQMAATEAGKSKSCPLAKQAQEAFVTAQINLPMGANVARDAVTQYMQYLQQFTPVVDNQVKQFCK